MALQSRALPGSPLLKRMGILGVVNEMDFPASFIELIGTSQLPVLADFWAEWCGPCRTISPSIQRLAREFSGRLLTVKVNIDRKPDIAEKFEVQSIPTIMLFWQGTPRMRLTGAYPYEVIKKNIEESWPKGMDA
jgi:thioredoxin 1